MEVIELSPLMTETSPAVQRLIASVVASSKDASDEVIAAKVKGVIGDVPPDAIKAMAAQFRNLKTRALQELPRMRWGASMTLDDIKVARFAFEAAQERHGLDEVAVRALLQETWGHLHGR